MSSHSMDSVVARDARSEPSRQTFRPWLIVLLLAALAIAGAILPRLLGYAPYGQQAMDEQIDREDSGVCQKFEFAAGTRQYEDCKLALLDLRHRHEALLAEWGRL